MKTRLLIAGYALTAMVSLGACDRIVYSGPTATTTSRPELYQEEFTQETATASLGEDQLTGLSRYYWSNGDGPLSLSVSYDPRSKTNTARQATQQAAKLSGVLKEKGIKDIQSRIAPVQDSGNASRTVISFNTLQARPPADCPEPLSMDFADREHAPDYKLGCSLETYTAQQIARPRDLLGSDAMDNNSGRRNGNLLEGYYVGKTFEELKGLNASQKAN